MRSVVNIVQETCPVSQLELCLSFTVTSSEFKFCGNYFDTLMHSRCGREEIQLSSVARANPPFFVSSDRLFFVSLLLLFAFWFLLLLLF